MGRAFVICLVAALCLLSCWVSVAEAQSTLFLDQVLRTLRDLDLALAAGEIDQEDYDLLLEALLQPEQQAESLLKVAASELETSRPTAPGGRFQYKSSLTQDLDGDAGFVRYDRLRYRDAHWEANLSFADRQDRELLIRSRNLRYQNQTVDLTVGSYQARLGEGLTLGGSRYHSELRRLDDFTASIELPIKNRYNGVLFGAGHRGLTLEGLVSYLEGESAANLVRAASIGYLRARRGVGIVAMQQRLRDESGGKHSSTFFAPYLHFALGAIEMWGESSFGIGKAAAHNWSLAHRGDRGRFLFQFFSYGRSYHNLQSGGYAYSDYSSAMIAGTDFSYRDKLAGRSGISVTTRAELEALGKLRLQLLRWQVRSERRECVAAKIQIENKPAGLPLSRWKVGLLWENLNLHDGGDSRRVASLSTDWLLSRQLKLRIYQKVERRGRGDNKTYPGRWRSRIEAALRPNLSALLELNYYDPDLDREANSYIYLAVGERIVSGGGVDLEALLQIRYHFGRKEWSNRELRLRVALIL